MTHTDLPTSEPTERRQQADRRAASRQGKYERRKNRCGGCGYFAVSEDALIGYCRYHQGEITATAFACPAFKVGE
ncbi:MAG: hypothetical protein AB7P76_00520 [Candidatus Melainabacteria bacterium]